MRPELLRPGEGTKFPLSRVLREKALAALLTCEIDTLIPYALLTESIGLSVTEDRRAREAVLSAGRVLLREHKLKLVNVRTVGYRLVRPDERVAVSVGERKRSRRWLKRALETVTYVALDGLPAEEVARILTEQARTALLLSIERRIGKQKALPPKSELLVPKGADLVRLFEKPRSEK
jgi:hypothetical protein